MYNEEMLKSMERVAAKREENAVFEPRRMTAEEKERMRSAMRERLSKSISEYCKNHPGTFAKLPGKVIE